MLLQQQRWLVWVKQQCKHLSAKLGSLRFEVPACGPRLLIAVA